MPANLPPQYFEVEKKFREAKTREEKIKYLREMIAVMPKHKGTEKLYGLLKQKLSKLLEEQERKVKSRRETIYNVPKEGAAQIVLLGLPNSGKSLFFNTLTNAKSLVADYPFSTTMPMVGMMPYENIKIQVVDLPPFIEDRIPGWQRGIARQSDMLIVIIDASSPGVLEDIDTVRKILEKQGVSDHPRLSVFSKMDKEESKENIKILKEMGVLKEDYIKVSAVNGMGIEEFKRKVFQRLDIIRVYTKPPGKEPDFEKPLVLKKQSTVFDAAKKLHKDFARKLLYARLWNRKGIRVSREHILEEGDVVEFHLKD